MSNKLDKLNQQGIRTRAVQALFQLDGKHEVTRDEAIQNAIESDDLMDNTVPEYLVTLVQGVLDHKAELDADIASHLAKGWSLSRINTVEKNILEVALYEMRYQNDVPNVVAVNEAVELAKNFNDEKSGRFVNGVLTNFVGE
jgi:N utilization substance protein B